MDRGDGELYLLEDAECDGRSMVLRGYDEETGEVLGQTRTHIVLSQDGERILKVLPDDPTAGWDASVIYDDEGTTIQSVEVNQEDSTQTQ